MIKKWFKGLAKPQKSASGKPGGSGSHNNKNSKSAAKALVKHSGTTNTTGSTAKASGKQNPKRKKTTRKRDSHQRRKSAQATNWDVGQFVVEPEAGKTRFHDLHLDDRIMHAIADLKFAYCSPIQAQILPFTLDGHDAIGKAQTGTGKTAAFLITILNDLLSNPIEEERYAGEPRALVIAPTRELVLQIGKDADVLAKYCDVNVLTLIGGADYVKQQRRLHNDVIDIVVATPGRLLDFHRRGDLHLDLIEILVVDEADRMLDMGFIPQVRQIIRATPQKSHRQTLLFSATFTDDVIRLTEQWTYEPVRVEIEPENVATDTVEQLLYSVSNQDKYAFLKKLLKQEQVESAIVFANRRDQTRRLEEKLKRDGFRCGLLSGEISQQKRTRTLEDFRNGKLKVLVATDVAGRGIHIDGISHVVNYTLPEDPEDYVHRIGRTGRAGQSGISVSLIGEEDAFNLMPIEELLGRKLKCQTPPEF